MTVLLEYLLTALLGYIDLLDISNPAVKKVCGPQEKRCEIESGSQEMAVMVG